MAFERRLRVTNGGDDKVAVSFRRVSSADCCRRVFYVRDLSLSVRAHTTPNAPVTLVIDIAFEFGCNFTQIMYRLGGARCLIKFVTGREMRMKPLVRAKYAWKHIMRSM